MDTLYTSFSRAHSQLIDDRTPRLQKPTKPSDTHATACKSVERKKKKETFLKAKNKKTIQTTTTTTKRRDN